MSAPLRVARLVLGLAVLALVASCSFSRFGYNQADTVAAWMINDYFDLDSEQKGQFQKRFDHFYAWHRYEQLPDYAAFLRVAKSRLQQGVSRDDVLWFVEGMRTRARNAARQAAPEAAAFLATLTPAQIDNLQRHWDKDNAKYVKEHKLNGTVEERAQADAKRLTKQLNTWLIPLNADQEQRAVALMRELPEMHQLHYVDRLRRQKEFLELLSHRHEDGQRFTERVTDWATNWERGRTPEHQQRLEAWRQKRAEVFVALDRTLTPQQRTAAVDRLQGYVSDFTQLAQRKDASPNSASR